MKTLSRHIVAVAVMIAGCAGVFGLVLGMNRLAPPPEAPPAAVAASFDITPPAPPKRPRARRERPKKRSQTRTAAPKPSLLSSISGASFGIPGLDGVDTSHLDIGQGAAHGDMVMTEGAVDEPPRPRRRTPPEYPKRAHVRGVTGYVILNLLIGTDGNVDQVKVLEAEPAGVFEHSAVSAVRTWAFQPATYDGQPVRVWRKQRIDFDQT